MSGSGNQARFYVRDAAQADLEAVLAMKAVAWREAYGHLRDEPFFTAAESTLPHQVEHWRRELARGTELWLAEDARGRCVGLASAGPVVTPVAPDPAAGPGVSGPGATGSGEAGAGPVDAGLPPLELRALYVLSEAQGSGVADALLARAVGSSPCRVRVVSADERARAFYRRHGFADVGAPVPMTGPWAGLDEQLMVRRGA
ncbi:MULTISPECIES: GNAT family N-acetyltransferase [Citricoccus]|uniref:GNAT family N-acetyltransferase n=1 Tax=Citricoccus TaxID=169133 RepID=UPI000255DFA6|nr:GNAT family N-acetyltransferase [Citricoccus sp. CH26A]